MKDSQLIVDNLIGINCAFNDKTFIYSSTIMKRSLDGDARVESIAGTGRESRAFLFSSLDERLTVQHERPNNATTFENDVV